MLESFKKFVIRGNVVDMAVGFTVGAAFATIARSLVDDMIMPAVSLLTGEVDFADRFWILKPGVEQPPPYTTLAEAQAVGAVTMNYGIFINNVLTFLLIALVMFAIIRSVTRVEEELEELAEEKKEPEAAEPANKKCPYCLSTIAYEATRCPHCTSELEPVAADSS
ncbi:MAG: large conductance mechanosensitive channel protein MscL [Chloroflexi bacterium]|nr:large conductance mechanosensitive channel protein MscL [Chloroflexota bacterium]MCI0577468.1 large conductance mechanosensitive channel protein MscL [Chloroflexota bacterium]MCI0647659.1 large conductance mechanosensitive channel protein MscL [Chloroflexota bacterium]MCI0730089.1 large conductance mechanosensitive channel protein MscL [Chloroflexota bacterium]